MRVSGFRTAREPLEHYDDAYTKSKMEELEKDLDPLTSRLKALEDVEEHLNPPGSIGGSSST